ncbi:NUDIX hydrolase [Planococcus faecalis]|uniref:Nudix hydrolase domain-containing protein n=1 Tax=Planococcus faecalis TaxID=1598147 RepID=A0ABN4XDX3_9BACL|nr:NUDIX domain-containing protein [Planococcus faecalis]AQU78016.1 hypothetical protein AJGP001_01265 [Planococcus faecalis]OHX52213.1 hypothetical protein BB777_13460 [Planococcus faecalis]
MENEKIRIYDENGIAQGVATRQTVHEKGYWHETFHCWVVGRENNKDIVYLQLRSKDKKDFPGLFDITAAGHLMADEAVRDGVREVQEELGLQVDFAELTSLGMIKDQINLLNFTDNERCHCFLYRKQDNNDATFELQAEEVSGIAKVEFEELAELVMGKKEEVEVEGFVTVAGKSSRFKKQIGLKDLVPHSQDYLKKVIEQIGLALKK